MKDKNTEAGAHMVGAGFARQARQVRPAEVGACGQPPLQ